MLSDWSKNRSVSNGKPRAHCFIRPLAYVSRAFTIWPSHDLERLSVSIVLKAPLPLLHRSRLNPSSPPPSPTIFVFLLNVPSFVFIDFDYRLVVVLKIYERTHESEKCFGKDFEFCCLVKNLYKAVGGLCANDVLIFFYSVVDAFLSTMDFSIICTDWDEKK